MLMSITDVTMLSKPEISSIRDPLASGSEASILDMAKYSLSIISRMKTRFESEYLGAMPPGLVTVSRRL